jgi:hypothetical protein
MTPYRRPWRILLTQYCRRRLRPRIAPGSAQAAGAQPSGLPGQRLPRNKLVNHAADPRWPCRDASGAGLEAS